MNRRNFLITGMIASGSIWFFNGRSLGAVQHRYKLAPESILPAGLENASIEIREAYRFAVANRDTLRYIPCYCGCAKDGHTSNASCYVKDKSPVDKPEFDPMSVG